MTLAYERFLESLEAPSSDRRWADDLDLAALAQLTPAERRRAERLLISRIATAGRLGRLAGALAVVGSLESVAPLRAALDAAEGESRVRVAMTLRRLDPEFDPWMVCLQALETGDFVTRGAAARALAESPPQRGLNALLAALDDDHFGVRVAAYEALLAQHGSHRPDETPRRDLGTAGDRLLSDDRAIARAAAEEIRTWFRER